MKKHDRLAIIGIILYFISWLITAVGNPIYRMALIRSDWNPKYIMLLSVPYTAALMAFNIAIGIWLFTLARRHNKLAWVWFMFGFIGGLLAPILFYAIEIYDSLQSKKG